MNPWVSWSISVFLIAFVAAPLTLLSLNLLDGWDLNAICPGTEQWCDLGSHKVRLSMTP